MFHVAVCSTSRQLIQEGSSSWHLLWISFLVILNLCWRSCHLSLFQLFEYCYHLIISWLIIPTPFLCSSKVLISRPFITLVALPWTCSEIFTVWVKIDVPSIFSIQVTDKNIQPSPVELHILVPPPQAKVQLGNELYNSVTSSRLPSLHLCFSCRLKWTMRLYLHYILTPQLSDFHLIAWVHKYKL